MKREKKGTRIIPRKSWLPWSCHKNLNPGKKKEKKKNGETISALRSAWEQKEPVVKKVSKGKKVAKEGT